MNDENKKEELEKEEDIEDKKEQEKEEVKQESVENKESEKSDNKVEEDKEETLLHKLFIAKTNNSFLQFFRYIFVGGIAAIVNIGALFVFTDIFGIHYIISNILGFILGLITNYLLSKMFIFTNENGMNKRKEFISYAIIGIIGLGVDTLFMLICTSGLGIYYLLSKIISTIITFIWNFGARKFMYHMERKKLKLSEENL